MKLAITTIPLDLEQTNVIDVRIKGPARVIHSFVAYKHKSPIIARRDSEVITVPIPTLVVEVSPDADMVDKRFVAIVPGMMLDSELPPLCCLSTELVHVATVVNPNDGRPVAIYEAPWRPADSAIAAP
jgi:hypothetical protein